LRPISIRQSYPVTYPRIAELDDDLRNRYPPSAGANFKAVMPADAGPLQGVASQGGLVFTYMLQTEELVEGNPTTDTDRQMAQRLHREFRKDRRSNGSTLAGLAKIRSGEVRSNEFRA
jgi:hypothetical protein